MKLALIVRTDLGMGRGKIAAQVAHAAVAAVLASGEADLAAWLADGQPRTLEEISRVYGVTRERIRQIEANTLSKLRHPSRSRALRDYLD